KINRLWIETPLQAGCVIDAPSSPRHERHVALLVAVAVAGAACGSVYLNWSWARSVQTGVAGLLPTWDAFNYYWCANNLLDLGSFGAGGEKCNWRPIYASFASTLVAIAGRNLHIVLLAQATLVSLAIVTLVRELWRWIGSVGALLALLLLGVFA